MLYIECLWGSALSVRAVGRNERRMPWLTCICENENHCSKWSAIALLKILIHQFMAAIISDRVSFWHVVTEPHIPLVRFCSFSLINISALSESITCNLCLPAACGHWQFLLKLPHTLACLGLQAAQFTRKRSCWTDCLSNHQRDTLISVSV